MQGGCVSARAAAIDTVQVPAMCHRAIATVQALAMCHRAIATVQAPAMYHCQKLSRAGVHTSGVPASLSLREEENRKTISLTSCAVCSNAKSRSGSLLARLSLMLCRPSDSFIAAISERICLWASTLITLSIFLFAA